MRTRITALLGIKYPILLAPANYVGTPEMVAAVSNAGGFGILASGRLAPDDLRADIEAIRKLTDKPFGAWLPVQRASVRGLLSCSCLSSGNGPFLSCLSEGRPQL